MDSCRGFLQVSCNRTKISLALAWNASHFSKKIRHCEVPQRWKNLPKFLLAFQKESSALNVSEPFNFISIPAGNQDYHSSICSIVKFMPLLHHSSCPRKRKWAGWNYLNEDPNFRPFGGHSAFEFIHLRRGGIYWELELPHWYNHCTALVF